MKKLNNILSILCLLLSSAVMFSCSSDGEDPIKIPEIEKPDADRIELWSVAEMTTEYSFDVNSPWMLDNDYMTLCAATPSRGEAGHVTITLQPYDHNLTNDTLRTTLTIIALGQDGSKTTKTIPVVQPPVFEIEQLSYVVPSEQNTLRFLFNTQLELDDVGVIMDGELKAMIEKEKDGTRAGDKVYYYAAKLPISENTGKNSRSGTFTLVSLTDDANYGTDHYLGLHSKRVEVIQEGFGASTSTDYSLDKAVKTLQTHTLGAGVPIVVMGDGFVDTDIKGGNYEKILCEAIEHLFDIEPMTSLRPYFDVYMINAISRNDRFGDKYQTIFGCEYDVETSTEIKVDMSSGKPQSYALLALGNDKKKLANANVLIVLNSYDYAGTTYFYPEDAKNGVATGPAYSFLTIPSKSFTGKDWDILIQHEMVGHCVGRLADEYNYEENGSLLDPGNEKMLSQLKELQGKGMFLNITTSSDFSQTIWADFVTDPRYQAIYASENLKCYEGAYGYYGGVYRLSNNSMMRSGTEFNAPSRCLIYRRVMNIANGFNLNYSLDDFIQFDQQSNK